MSAPAQAVHVVAVGARTPVGLTAEATAAAVRAGISRQAAHPFMIDQKGDNVRSAIDGRLEPTVIGWERLVALARSALDEVIAKLTTGMAWRAPLPVLLALPEPRPGFTARDAERVLAELRATPARGGVPLKIEGVGRGHAGGLQALYLGAQRVARGEQDFCIAGGVESYFEADTIDWLQEHLQLAGEDIRAGFTPGEGAGFLAIASAGARKQYRFRSLGVVRGCGVAAETKLIKTDAVNTGEGLAQAVRAAAETLRLPVEAVDTSYCDINGERYRSEEWGFMLMRVPEAFRGIGYVAPADCWGDVGAASGPLFCNLAVQAWARRYAEGPRALVSAGSEAGLRGAAILEAPPAA
jgi:3-oxoacyl-[acyl-carrier-protein] synthase-1